MRNLLVVVFFVLAGCGRKPLIIEGSWKDLLSSGSVTNGRENFDALTIFIFGSDQLMVKTTCSQNANSVDATITVPITVDSGSKTIEVRATIEASSKFTLANGDLVDCQTPTLSQQTWRYEAKGSDLALTALNSGGERTLRRQ